MPEILYEDNQILVCIKPFGVSSADDGGENNMTALLRKMLKKPDAYIGTVHRLDMTVGGVMVFAKTPFAAAELSKQIQNGDFMKEYLACVQGCPAQLSGEFKDLLFKDSSKNKTFVVGRMRKGVREAVLDYSVIEESKIASEERISLVKIRLQTGRTHQIRVQFSSRRMPVVGDVKYGSTIKIEGIGLWSYCVSFVHPKSKEQLIFYHQPCVKSFPWSCFNNYTTPVRK